MVASASMIPFRICSPSHIDRVAPVPFGDHELVTGREAIEGLPELWPAGQAPARSGVLENLVAALRLECPDLALELLGLGADAGIADPARR